MHGKNAINRGDSDQFCFPLITTFGTFGLILPETTVGDFTRKYVDSPPPPKKVLYTSLYLNARLYNAIISYYLTRLVNDCLLDIMFLA